MASFNAVSKWILWNVFSGSFVNVLSYFHLPSWCKIIFFLAIGRIKVRFSETLFWIWNLVVRLTVARQTSSNKYICLFSSFWNAFAYWGLGIGQYVQIVPFVLLYIDFNVPSGKRFRSNDHIASMVLTSFLNGYMLAMQVSIVVLIFIILYIDLASALNWQNMIYHLDHNTSLLRHWGINGPG